MANYIRNIAIVGAGGQMGTFITSALIAKNRFKITAVSRQGSPNTFPESVHIARVDYSKPDTLVEALKGQDALICTMSVRAPREQPNQIVEAAAKAGVPWIIPNEWGSDGSNEQIEKDTLIGVPKRANRELIEKLGVSSWIGICCSFWYEYSLSGPGLYGFELAKREVTFFDEGTQRITTSTWAQTARAVAEILSLPTESDDKAALTLNSYRNRYAYISSFALTQREMFDVVKRVTGTSDVDWKIDSVPAKERFEKSSARVAAGDRSAFGHLLYSRYFFPGENAGWFELTKEMDNEKLGLPKEDLEEFTKEAIKLAESGYYVKQFSRG
ncbi:NAD(P)-binding protein [Corynespora cassiicola Philippines]|uniref:NAD(P)-binding protein n=1 Tax=Corynespora cassiicola Philippines TaxID=1448308 RepID=A0A2T2PCM7_CORCC|nr:NAD(P)-binding protein [Corynespora cassiicola Philippines]